LRSGEINSVALTELMLERIEAHNDQLNAFITVTADLAREQASQADEEMGRGHDRGPLHGIPMAIKDLFATNGIRTTCGSKLFEDWIPDYDATAVKHLREAGAVLLGKTGLHELGTAPPASIHSSAPSAASTGRSWPNRHPFPKSSSAAIRNTSPNG